MDASHDEPENEPRSPSRPRPEAADPFAVEASARPSSVIKTRVIETDPIKTDVIETRVIEDDATETDVLEADALDADPLDADAIELEADAESEIGPDEARESPVVHPAGEASAGGLTHPNALSAYMAQLRHHAPISREEEHALAVRWVEEGDVEAAKALVVANLRLVVKIAMEYRRAWTNTLDLVQEGNVGLMEAVQRFDPYQGVKLSSYAVYWIRAYILKYILDNMRSVRLGTTRASRKLFFRLNKEKRELERLGYDVEPRLLAERLDVTEEDVTDMEARLSRPDLSFDAPLRADEADGMTFGDRMAAPGLSSEATVGASELREVFMQKIEAFAATLDERDLQILRERILAEEPLTLADLGERFAVTRERVRQLEAKLVKRLRRYMEENLVDFEYYGPGAG